LKVEELNAKYIKIKDSSLRSEDDVDDFLSFGEKLERGRSPRSKMCHPEERKRRGISINGGGHSPPPTPPKNVNRGDSSG